MSNVKLFLVFIKLKIKNIVKKSNANIPDFSITFIEKSSVKKELKTVMKKLKKKKISKPIKLMGLDLLKKLANIISFIIFAA